MPDNGSLAAQQATLVAALVAGAPLPAGFDAHRAHLVARLLRDKRRKALVHAVPEVPRAVGDTWRDHFEQFAATQVASNDLAPLDDAIAFCRWFGGLHPVRLNIHMLAMRLRGRRILSATRRVTRRD